jgi:hypothetical protein
MQLSKEKEIAKSILCDPFYQPGLFSEITKKRWLNTFFNRNGTIPVQLIQESISVK